MNGKEWAIKNGWACPQYTHLRATQFDKIKNENDEMRIILKGLRTELKASFKDLDKVQWIRTIDELPKRPKVKIGKAVTREYLTWGGGYHCEIGEYCFENQKWMIYKDGWKEYYPLYWMKLPKQPTKRNIYERKTN